MSQLNVIKHFLHLYQTQCILASICLVIILLLAFIHSRRKQLQSTYNSLENDFNHTDIDMLAGDDVICTQLDLARAYMEMGKNKLAKSILLKVVKQGKNEQKARAQELMNAL